MAAWWLLSERLVNSFIASMKTSSELFGRASAIVGRPLISQITTALHSVGRTAVVEMHPIAPVRIESVEKKRVRAISRRGAGRYF